MHYVNQIVPFITDFFFTWIGWMDDINQYFYEALLLFFSLFHMDLL